MTSKTFKNRVSVRDSESVLEITDTPAGIRITVGGEDRIVSGWFNPVQGAGISLAILEAAGYGEEVVTDGSPDGHIQVAKYYLYEGVKAHASINAEARERAELEAEALELFRASQCIRTDGMYASVPSFAALSDPSKTKWLAVARRAREMRTEK